MSVKPLLLVKINFHLDELSWHCHIFETEKEMEGWGLMQWELPAGTAKDCPVSLSHKRERSCYFDCSDFLPTPFP